jgi:hypothetical protein
MAGACVEGHRSEIGIMRHRSEIDIMRHRSSLKERIKSLAKVPSRSESKHSISLRIVCRAKKCRNAPHECVKLRNSVQISASWPAAAP